MDDVYDDIDEYNPTRKREIIFVFEDVIAEIIGNKRFQVVVKELFVRCRKLNISVVFNTQSVPKEMRLNSTHHLIMNINKRRELQNIAINHSADTDYKDFMKIYKKCTSEPYIFYYWYCITNYYSFKI